MEGTVPLQVPRMYLSGRGGGGSQSIWGGGGGAPCNFQPRKECHVLLQCHLQSQPDMFSHPRVSIKTAYLQYNTIGGVQYVGLQIQKSENTS